MLTPFYFNEKEGEDLTRVHAYDAGADIRSAIDTEVLAWGKAIIPTGVYAAIPDGYVGILKSRSGLAAKHDIEVGAGVIDAGYRSEIKVVLRNFSNQPYFVEAGNKIAQMLIIPVFLINWAQVDNINMLGDSERGVNGFGSSGK